MPNRRAALKLPYANLSLVRTGDRITGASNVKRHATLGQTHRAAAANGRVGGPDCFRFTLITDLTERPTNLAAGYYYAVSQPGARGTLRLLKRKDKAIALLRANRKLGRSQVFMLAPVSSPVA